MAYNEKSKSYVMNYIKEHKERIVLDVNKGKRDQYKRLAESRGKSLSKFITEYLETELQKLNEKAKADN